METTWEYNYADETWHEYAGEAILSYIDWGSKFYYPYVFNEDDPDSNEDGWLSLGSFIDFADAKKAIYNYRNGG